MSDKEEEEFLWYYGKKAVPPLLYEEDDDEEDRPSFEGDRAVEYYGRVCRTLEWHPIPGTPDEPIEETVLKKKEQLLLRDPPKRQTSIDVFMIEKCLSISGRLFVPEEAAKRASEELLFRFVFESLMQEGCGYREESKWRRWWRGEGPNSRLGCFREMRAYRETQNFVKAYRKFHRWAKEEDGGLLTVGMLQEVHRVLMKGLPGEQGSGRWSTRPRGAEFEGVLHWYAPAEDLEESVQRMVDEYNRRWKKNGEEGKLETLEFFELMGWWVVWFLKLHPFNDGNGRMVRLIFAYALEAYGFPLPVWIKVWPEDQED